MYRFSDSGHTSKSSGLHSIYVGEVEGEIINDGVRNVNENEA